VVRPFTLHGALPIGHDAGRVAAGVRGHARAPRQAAPGDPGGAARQPDLRGHRGPHPLDRLPSPPAPRRRPDARRCGPGAGRGAGVRVLVTGAHGFLGSHITERLVAGGDVVRALVSPWGDLHNLRVAMGAGEVEVVRADVSKPGDLAGALEGVDAVVHAAARVVDWGP